MNEIQRVPHDVVQKTTEGSQVREPSQELQARIKALQDQIDALHIASTEGAVVPEGMQLVKAGFTREWSELGFSGDSEGRTYQDVYILLPDDVQLSEELVITCREERQKYSGSTHWSIQTKPDYDYIWSYIQSWDRDEEETVEISGSMQYEPSVEYTDPEVDYSPFAMGLSPEEAVVSYKAKQLEIQSQEKTIYDEVCPSCAFTGAYCGSTSGHPSCGCFIDGQYVSYNEYEKWLDSRKKQQPSEKSDQ